MVDDVKKEVEFITKTMKFASRLAGGLKTKDGTLLHLVSFKEKGEGFYYSISDKAPVLINKGSEWFLVPFVPKDERDRICLYSPYLFGMSIFIMVPEEEIEIVGFN